jgi:hypothetical protein
VSFYLFTGSVKWGVFPGRVDVHDGFKIPALGQEVASSLVGFSHDKRLGPASGTVEITLKPRHLTNFAFPNAPWMEILHEGDWWSIEVIKNGVKQGVSFGKIDTISMSVNAGRGEGAGLITVAGRDIGFALDDTPVYFNPLDPNIDKALGINLIATVDSLLGRADKVCVGMIQGMMGRDPLNTLLGGHLDVPPGLSGSILKDRWVDFVDFTSCVDTDLQGEVSSANAISPEGGGSVWSYVDTWRNPVMNELFIDTVPTPGTPKKACLVLREKPFVDADLLTQSPWFGLLHWCVDVSTIVSSNLTHGSNRINHIQLVGDILADMNQDGLALYAPKMNTSSVRRYGLKRLEERTRFFDDRGQVGAESEFQGWLKTLTAWNALNHEYWSGQIVLGEMRAEIRVGQKLVLTGNTELAPGVPGTGALASGPGGLVDPRALTFYVEGVRHSYRAGERPSASTSIMVSRGYIEGERIPAVAAAVAEFTGPVPFLPNPFRKRPATPNIMTTGQARSIAQNSAGGGAVSSDLEAQPE